MATPKPHNLFAEPEVVDGELVDPATGEVIVSKAQLAAVTIDDLALDEEMMRAPRDIAYWQARFSESVNAYLLEEAEHEKASGRRHLEIKAVSQETEKLVFGKGQVIKKPTVDDIKAAVAADEELFEIRQRVIQAEALMKRLKGFCDALTAKKDMTQSLGAKLREQLRGDPALRASHRESREYSND